MDGGCQSTISWLRIAKEMDAIDGLYVVQSFVNPSGVV